MSVIDNVKVGLHHSQNYSLIASVLHTPNYYKGEEAIEEMALSLLRVFDLDQYAQVKANNLPYGKQRKLEIARALAASPDFMLLDEPFAGIDPIAIGEIKDNIRKLSEDKGLGVLIVTGARRSPKPAAKIIALLTLQGAKAFKPCSLI